MPILAIHVIIYNHPHAKSDANWLLKTQGDYEYESCGPFRYAKPALWSLPESPDTWGCAVDFSWWKDGTSNQIIFGEKRIPCGSVISIFTLLTLNYYETT